MIRFLRAAERSIAFADRLLHEYGRIPLILDILPHEETEDSLTYYYGLETLAVYASLRQTITIYHPRMPVSMNMPIDINTMRVVKRRTVSAAVLAGLTGLSLPRRSASSRVAGTLRPGGNLPVREETSTVRDD